MPGRRLTPLLVALALVPSAPAGAATITSPGPLTRVQVSADLNCAVDHAGDSSPAFYGDTACATLVATGGTLYGPATIPAGEAAAPRTPFTRISQVGPTGAGTVADPFVLQTVVGAGGLRITQTDSYVVGQEAYTTRVALANTGASESRATLYRAGDCFLGDRDTGFGQADAATGAVACREAVKAERGAWMPGPRVEQFFPISPGSSYYEARWDQVWGRVGSRAAFPGTCRCEELLDNGAGLSWDVVVPPGATEVRTSLVAFSPQGRVPLSIQQSAAPTAVDPGRDVTYTLTISNPNTLPVTLSSIEDTLPEGFAYVPGSSSAAGEPVASGRTLTFAGPVSIPAAGSASISFRAIAPSVPGEHLNEASAQAADGYTVAPVEPGAAVRVNEPAPTTPAGRPGEPSGTVLGSEPEPSIAPPENARSVNLVPVRGTVLVNGRPITAAVHIPIGSVVDTSNGEVELFSASPTGEIQSAKFYDGSFKVLQERGDPTTELKLLGGRLGDCSKRSRKVRGRASGAKPGRRVWGDGKGKFRTNGRNSSASVRGTKWFVEDTCKGTSTKVVNGVVTVRDFAKRKTIRLTAGQSYLAPAKR
ncbi:MAG: DUF11 domain-containing protein [Thermoleophilaceae bacterium]|nr:DUF11 domain-containing protein [Thermoleophilaceae bacterium]